MENILHLKPIFVFLLAVMVVAMVPIDLSADVPSGRRRWFWEYEQLHPSKISEDEVISGLAFAHPLEGGTITAGHISNKTMQIALNFQNETERLNYATILEIDQELHALQQRIAKIEFYVSQLEKKQAEVMRKYYFEEKTWPECKGTG